MRKDPTSSVRELADMCRTAEDELRSVINAFAKLKKAIEEEGYTVIWHTAHDTYSVTKPSAMVHDFGGGHAQQVVDKLEKRIAELEAALQEIDNGKQTPPLT